MPNGLAQEQVVRSALADAGVSPAEVDYVEAHGTGTSLGDPIEVEALAAAYGEGRGAGSPLRIGSVKSNIGHAEAAAGAAGLIKAALCLKYRQLPASLHIQTPNPLVDWNSIPVRPVSKREEWASARGLRLAGVSSFGFGGSNVHLILEEAPPVAPNKTAFPVQQNIFTASAKDDEALRQLAQAHLDRLEKSDMPLRDLCYTVSAGRAHWNKRIAVISSTQNELIASLQEALRQTEFPDVSKPPQIAFLFTGQGSQYHGMGRELFQTQPAFRDEFTRCDAILQPILNRSLIDLLFQGGEDHGAIHQTAFTQPALFALEYSLAKLWMSWGALPRALLGHSVGEYAAAAIAGVFSLEDGAALIAERARLMQSLPQDGAMAAVLDQREIVEDLIRPYRDQVSCAAFNGPRNTVISGRRDAMARVFEQLEKQKIRFQPLTVSHAFHSCCMEPILDAFEDFAKTVSYHPPQIDLISNHNGAVAGGEIAAPRYWRDHIRNPVQFSQGMNALGAMNIAAYLEVGPKPVLCGMGRYCAANAGAVWLPSLNEGENDWNSLLPTLAQLYRQGADVRWAEFYRPFRGRVLDLPTYPFQRQSYWTTEIGYKPRMRSSADASANAPRVHSLLRRQIGCPAHPGEWAFETQIDLQAFAYLRSHSVFGQVILPAAFYLEAARAGFKTALPGQPVSLRSVVFHQSCVIEEGQAADLQLVIARGEDAALSFQFFSRNGSGQDWTRLVSGAAQTASPPGNAEALGALQTRIQAPVDRETFYQTYRERGADFGEEFQRIKSLWTNRDECLAQLAPQGGSSSGGADCIHPALLDACAQAFGGLFMDAASPSLYLQTGVDRYQVLNDAAAPAWCHVTRAGRQPEDGVHLANLALYDDQQQVVATIDGMRVQKASASTRGRSPFGAHDFYSLEWIARKRPPSSMNWMAPNDIAKQVLTHLQSEIQSDELKRYAELLQGLDRLACMYIQAHLGRTVPGFVEDAWFSFEELAAGLGLHQSFHRLLRRWLYWLERHAMMKPAGGQWQAAQIVSQRQCENFHNELAAQFPGGWAEQSVMQRCAARMGDILRGECSAAEVLFAQDTRGETEAVYRDSPGARLMNNQLKNALQALLSARPAGRKIRILEIGAGTGGATSYLLPSLPPDAVEYTFTDLTPHFLAKAKESFRQYGFIQYKTLDIERAPAAQGFTPHGCDVVIAFNVLHAVRNLKQALAHVKQLMAPAAALILLENTAPMAWVELVWGMTEGWWRFDDLGLRTDHPLLDGPQWLGLLREAEFEQTAAVSPADAGRFELFKQSILIAQNSTSPQNDVWLHFSGDSRQVGCFKQELGASSQRCIQVVAGDQFKQISEREFVLDPHQRGCMTQLLNALSLPDGATLRCVYQWGDNIASSSADALPASCLTASVGLVHVLQALGEHPNASVYLVTCGAHSLDGEAAPGFAQSVLWGFAKNAILECPRLTVRMLDLPAAPDRADWRAALDEMRGGSQEDHVAIRGAQRFVARIGRTPKCEKAMPAISPGGAYLITGGLGALGLATAQWLIEQGATNLRLTGRRGAASAEARQWLEQSRQAGVSIVVEQADAADPDALREILNRLDGEGAALHGVVHAAGVAGFQPMGELTQTDIKNQFAAKVAGAWNLHEALKNRPLDFFVMYSSMVSLWGANGQSHYVAANQFLDALAAQRRALGLPGLSVNWGPVVGGGMFPGEIVDELNRMGIQTTPKEQTLPVIKNVFERASASVAPAKIDWTRFLGVYEARRQRPLFALLRSSRSTQAPVEQKAQRALAEKIANAPAAVKRELLAGHLQQVLANVLCLGASRPINVEQGLFDIGMDSLTAMEFKNQLEKDLQTPLSSTLAFDYSTIETLTAHLLDDVLAPQQEAASNAAPRRGEASAASKKAIEQMSEEEAEQMLLKKLESM